MAFFCSAARRTASAFRAGCNWRKLVKLFRKAKSKFYWYDFTVGGQRYRGSTQETRAVRAVKIASLRLAHVVEGVDRTSAQTDALPLNNRPGVFVPTMIARLFSSANAETISPALAVCSFTINTTLPWKFYDPSPSVTTRIDFSTNAYRAASQIRVALWEGIRPKRVSSSRL